MLRAIGILTGESFGIPGNVNRVKRDVVARRVVETDNLACGLAFVRTNIAHRDVAKDGCCRGVGWRDAARVLLRRDTGEGGEHDRKKKKKLWMLYMWLCRVLPW